MDVRTGSKPVSTHFATVMNAVKKEREYQDKAAKACGWSPQTAESKPPETFIMFAELYLQKAKEAALRARRLSHTETMANIRKAAALLVKAMELHGVPDRNMDDLKKRPDYIKKEEEKT